MSRQGKEAALALARQEFERKLERLKELEPPQRQAKLWRVVRRVCEKHWPMAAIAWESFREVTKDLYLSGLPNGVVDDPSVRMWFGKFGKLHGLYPYQQLLDPETEKRDRHGDIDGRVAAEEPPTATVTLSERERKIWKVITHGSKGLEYCRELGNVGIRPRKTGSWKGAPGTYRTAYLAGEPWRHRIQDEKSKIRRKAELAKLASE